MKPIKMSVVIPCYNEGETIPLLLKRYATALEKRDDIEIIIVNDGSKDFTYEVLEKEKGTYPFLKILHIKQNAGYGNAIFSGLKESQGEFVGWTHGDLQTPPEDTLRALHILEEAKSKNLFVKGRRMQRPFTDSVFTFGMSIFESLLFGYLLYDINAQPNIFPRTFLSKLDNPPKDFSFDLYVLLVAKRSGMKVMRFPVFFGERYAGISSWNISWKSKYEFIKRTILFSLSLRRS